MFWTGIVIGCFIGTAFGVVIMAIAAVGSQSERRREEDEPRA